MKPRFKPCPICGNELDADHNLFYFDDGNEWLTELNHIRNYDDMMDPVNICDEDIWANLDENERRSMTDEYEAAVENVDLLLLRCPCGFSFGMDPHDVDFPRYHWLDEAKERANRRWMDDNEDGPERGLQMDPQVPQVREQADMELLLQLRGRAVSGEDEVSEMLLDPCGPVQDAQAGEEGVE